MPQRGIVFTIELVTEIQHTRDAYVHDQVSGALNAAEGDLTRAQIDDCEIQARIRWDQRHPAMASVLRDAYPLVSR